MNKFFAPMIVIYMLTHQATAYNYLKPDHEQYQDIIINNVVVSHGARECEKRYLALKPLLDNYKRPFTVLDIGASQGYFSFRIAHDYPHAVCVMIEGNYSSKWKIADQLQDLCALNTELNNVIFLKKKITVQDLETLAQCEHFDVVLCFNVIHHFKTLWQSATDAIFSLGDNIIIETPPANEHAIIWAPLIDEYLKAQQGIILCEVPRHTNPKLLGKMYLFEKPATISTRSADNTTTTINSNYHEKYSEQIIDGISMKNIIQAGIRKTTYKQFNGVFPKNDSPYIQTT